MAELIRDHYVAVAVYHSAQLKRQDPEGDLYRKLWDQFPAKWKDPNAAVAFDATGKVLGFANDPTPRVDPMLRDALRDFKPPSATVVFPATRPVGTILGLKLLKLPGIDVEAAPEVCRVDEKHWPLLPAGGMVVQVNGMDPARPPAKPGGRGLGRSTLWVRKDEVAALVGGEFPRSLAVRIARFNLVDNSTGKSRMWKPETVKQADLKLLDGRITGPLWVDEIQGTEHSWFRGETMGFVEVKDGRILRFDVVIRGEAKGIKASYSPDGPYTYVLAMRLAADSTDESLRVPPPGYFLDLENYLR